MKRKDWKIKRLKKNIFDKKLFNKKSQNCFFLRKLKIRKSNILIKKNLEPHYIFYKELFNNFNNKKNRYINNFILLNSNKNIILFPVYFVKKKVFNNFNNYTCFFKKYNLNYIFLKNKYNLSNWNGLNLFLFNNLYKNKNNLFFKNLINDIEKSNDKDVIIFKKIFYDQVNLCNSFEILNYHISYNIYLINIVEVYKILIYLKLFKIIK